MIRSTRSSGAVYRELSERNVNNNMLNPAILNGVLLATFAGSLIAIQAVVNTRMGRDLGNPLLGTLVSFLVGTLSVIIYCLATRVTLPPFATLTRIPWWAWTGGLIGAFFVTVVIKTVPKIGVGALVGFTVGGQMLMAVLLDHFGLLGLTRHPITPGRLLGMALLIAGVALLKIF